MGEHMDRTDTASDDEKARLRRGGEAMMLDILTRKFREAPWIALYTMIEWGMTIHEIPGMEEVLEQHKRYLITSLLKSLAASSGGDLTGVQVQLERLIKTGVRWPELVVIQRSLDADMAKDENLGESGSRVQKPTPQVDDEGNRWWYLRRQLHREDGPAIERANGDRVWRLNGQLHRTDGPAVEFTTGDRWWYLRDQLHREDGPAVEFANGDREWWIRGQLHRTDGPAIERATGDHEWWLNGLRHRTDGPAIERATGDHEWWLNGLRHRTDGPAVELADGNRAWYVDGQQHRETGPATEWADGRRGWWLHDQQMAFDKWLKRTKSKLDKSTIMRFLLLMIKQGNAEDAARCMAELTRQGFDYPEFEVMQRSIQLDLREGSPAGFGSLRRDHVLG